MIKGTQICLHEKKKRNFACRGEKVNHRGLIRAHRQKEKEGKTQMKRKDENERKKACGSPSVTRQQNGSKQLSSTYEKEKIYMLRRHTYCTPGGYMSGAQQQRCVRCHVLSPL